MTEGEFAANFDSQTVTYLFGERETLVLAYAATIHKSEGSEYPGVVIPVLTQHYAVVQRNLLYPGSLAESVWWWLSAIAIAERGGTAALVQAGRVA